MIENFCENNFCVNFFSFFSQRVARYMYIRVFVEIQGKWYYHTAKKAADAQIN